MGGLTTERNFPAPRYDFEMLHAETGEPYIHFNVSKANRTIPRPSSTKEPNSREACALRCVG